jgi:hypothetical protein
MLSWFAETAPLTTYALGGQAYEITVIKLVIGVIIILFSLFELWPFSTIWHLSENTCPGVACFPVSLVGFRVIKVLCAQLFSSRLV